MGQELVIKPIGLFRSEMKNPYDLPRQPDDSSVISCVELFSRQNFEQALDSLDQFDRIWVIYHFHHNSNWKPMTLPPRGTDKKIGVFSTRSPYRPNPLGLSCLRLLRVDGLKLWVEGADLMNETPILDIKPYIPVHDAFPEASMGWLKEIEEFKWTVTLSTEAEASLQWLTEQGEEKIRHFIYRQLEYDPVNPEKKRVSICEDGIQDELGINKNNSYTLAYRTWRIDFEIDETKKSATVLKIRSGYSNEELCNSEDPYGDKGLHRKFVNTRLTE